MPITCPRLGKNDNSHVEEWEKQMRRKIRDLGISTNLKDLIIATTPDEFHDNLKRLTNLESLFEAVKKILRPTKYLEVLKQPYQRDYVFMRDYLEAVEEHRRKLHPHMGTDQDRIKHFLVWDAHLAQRMPTNIRQCLQEKIT